MTDWQSIPNAQRFLYSQIGVLPIDDFTGEHPKYAFNAALEYQNASGAWDPVDQTAVRTPTGVLSFPQVGRSAHAGVSPVLKYRMKLHSRFYRAEYLMNVDALEFDVRPYDDTVPPAVIPTHAKTVLLFPSPSYQYANAIRVVHGLIQDAGGDPVANVEVMEGVREHVLSDERGAFSLPLRWPPISGPVVIDAFDHRTGRSDSMAINLPADLSTHHVLTIT